MIILIIRNSSFIRYFWGIFALYILNCSVDAPDPYSEHYSEDLSFNDQESIIEMIVEKVMGFEDSIAEYDDNDENKELILKKNPLSGYFDIFEVSGQGSDNFFIGRKEGIFKYQPFFSSSFIEIQSPPPEV